MSQEAAGKVLYAGLREWSPFVALQIEYSLVERTVEHELIPMAHAWTLVVLPWSALGAYVESNRGRRVEFRVEVLGEARTSTGYIDTATGWPTTAETETIYGKEHDDAGLPGRLIHWIKRLGCSCAKAKQGPHAAPVGLSG